MCPVSDERKDEMSDIHDILYEWDMKTIKVAVELLAEMGEWSEPVRVRYTEDPFPMLEFQGLNDTENGSDLPPISDEVKCEQCNGSGYFQGHGHVPGWSDFAGREHDCSEVGCPYPCGHCHGGVLRVGEMLGSPEVSDDAPFFGGLVVSDVAEVKEALELYEAAEFKSEVSWPQPPIVDAARRWVRVVETGEQVRWCETHNQPPAECSPTRGDGPGHFIVPVLVVRIDGEETE